MRTRGPQRFHYTYDDIARLFGWTRDQVMRTARAKSFDVTDLGSVAYFAMGVIKGVHKPTAPRYGKRAKA